VQPGVRLITSILAFEDTLRGKSSQARVWVALVYQTHFNGYVIKTVVLHLPGAVPGGIVRLRHDGK
jgi:hypothetical protein